MGAGLAGLSVALHAAPLSVLVLSPVPLGDACSSAWAQGGMAAALNDDDSAKSHAADTLAAGAGLVDEKAAETLTLMGAETIKELAALGVPFDRESDGDFALSREAAHSKARVARVKGDLAGKAILETVVAAARKADHISIREGVRVIALLQTPDNTVCGVRVRGGETEYDIIGTSVVLATGGVGGLFAVTTNPADLRGEGLGLAALAGATICDPEFVQFHPTAIKIGSDPAPLATEALRGEGALLIDKNGRRFCFDDDPLGELAPRDIVARAVFRADRELGGAYLDATQSVGAHFPDHFPTVFAACMKAGIDPRNTPIPVTPAVHYHMGGIKVDLDGQSSVAGLFAVGECASTGVHGANRLASNSLLEAAAFGKRAAETLKQHSVAVFEGDYDTTPIAPYLPPVLKQTLRQAMSDYCGVVRTRNELKFLQEKVDELIRDFGPALSLLASRLIVFGALNRCESRGAHFRSDYPETLPEAKHTLITLQKQST